MRADMERHHPKRMTAAEAFTKWAWDNQGRVRHMAQFFKTYGITVVQYGVPLGEKPDTDSHVWWELTFRDDSVAYLVQAEIMGKTHISASLMLPSFLAKQQEAGFAQERWHFAPKEMA